MALDDGFGQAGGARRVEDPEGVVERDLLKGQVGFGLAGAGEVAESDAGEIGIIGEDGDDDRRRQTRKVALDLGHLG